MSTTPPSPTLALALDLMARSSVTPADAGCLDAIAAILEPAGFDCERMDAEGVSNLWAVYGASGPMLCLVGHTDVVPPGDESAWMRPPFEPCVAGGELCGRGAADMKAAVAAMVIAAESHARDGNGGRVALLLTSDEEGPATHGARHVVEQLRTRDQIPDWTLVGEPSSDERLGDRIRIGRRGSLTGSLRLRGVQGHVAFPDVARNAIHDGVAFMQELASTVWDEGTEDFPPTSFQWVSVHAGVANNVIPGEFSASFNLRYSPALTAEQIERHVTERLEAVGVDFELAWTRSAEPFGGSSDGNGDGTLADAVSAAVETACGKPPSRDCGGGTSDGRFLAAASSEVVELGHVSKTIHAVDERIPAEDVERLTAIYRDVMRRLLSA
jgi:succinyl-diaminopimelate desuccinylase